MTTTSLAYLIVALVTMLGADGYRRLWIKWGGTAVTPTGFGVILAPLMLCAALAADASLSMIVALSVVVAATLPYWLDDLVELSAKLRIAISGVAGIGIGFAFLGLGSDFSPLLAGSAILAAGLVCIILTNMVNFYDGADVNLAAYIVLTVALILTWGPAQAEWAALATAMLSFALAFAVMNCRPRTIYFGDSGSFAFAGFLTLMAVAFIANPQSVPPEAAIPSALPALDTIFVFTIRLRERHDLLTRNYLHLYQQVEKYHRRFIYLLPQFANAALCLAASAAFQALGLGRIVSVILALPAVTIPFYFLCRWTLLAPTRQPAP